MIRDKDISVILVDQEDEFLGYGDKLDVHRKGLLHRAFSVLLFNDKGELLIQKRADDKYHAGGLWANTVCGHPFPGEEAQDGASRRLFEELGIHANLNPLTHIYYRKDLDQGMIEHEYVHVFEAHWDGQSIAADPREVSEIEWLSPVAIRADMHSHPKKYAAWFIHYMDHHFNELFTHHMKS